MARSGIIHGDGPNDGLKWLVGLAMVIIPGLFAWCVSLEVRLAQAGRVAALEARLQPLEVEYEVRRRLEGMAGDSPVARMAVGHPASQALVESLRAEVTNARK